MRIVCNTCASSPPIIIRDGDIKSANHRPCCKNSGLATTQALNFSRNCAQTPRGKVDLITKTQCEGATAITSATTPYNLPTPLYSSLTGTATILSQNFNVPNFTHSASASSNPISKKGDCPALTLLCLSSSRSQQIFAG